MTPIPHNVTYKKVGGNSYNMTLTYDNFIETLYETFPDFKDSLDYETLKLLEDNQIVTFSFFIDHFYKQLGDEQFEQKLTDFLVR